MISGLNSNLILKSTIYIVYNEVKNVYFHITLVDIFFISLYFDNKEYTYLILY
jgi:hypothetical protein